MRIDRKFVLAEGYLHYTEEHKVRPSPAFQTTVVTVYRKGIKFL